MTSAYIVPDITMRAAPAETQPRLSASAQTALDKIAHHERDNCTVCRRVSSYGKGDYADDQPPVGRVKVLRPVPAPKRMPEPEPYEDEPTMRPSQPPLLALAAVMKALEDELAHLRMEHAEYQSAYNDLDVTLGKNKRKSILKQMDTLTKAIDTKADQIYALYDALEGQQQTDARGLTGEQVEVTLDSPGLKVELETVRIKSEKPKVRITSKSNRKNIAESVSSEEDGLPWEGVEETMQTSRSGRFCLPRKHRAQC